MTGTRTTILCTLTIGYYDTLRMKSYLEYLKSLIGAIPILNSEEPFLLYLKIYQLIFRTDHVNNLFVQHFLWRLSKYTTKNKRPVKIAKKS